MKVLIVGLGSIGRRHMGILQSFGNIDLAALRSGSKQQNSSESCLELFSVSEALKFAPDGVIVCNPTSLHINAALPFLKEGIKVFIEKPISDSSENLNILKPYRHLIKVAYCLRFLDTYEFLKREFEVNPPFKISFKRSFYLPHWHPNSDYRQEYVARKDLGGGVLRTFSHEIDLAVYWFGIPNSVIGVTDKIGFLDIDTDDFAFFTLKMESGVRLNYELDLYSPLNINQGEAFTIKGKYTWDTNKVSFATYEGQDVKVLYESSEDSLNKMYEKQLKDFLNFINNEESRACSLDQAAKSIEIIESIG